MKRTRIFMVNQTDESNRYGVGRYIETIADEVKERENTFELVIITIGVKGLNSVEIKTKQNLTHLDIPRAVHNLGGISQLSYKYSQAIFCLLSDHYSFCKTDIFHFNSNMQHFLIKEVKKNTLSLVIYTIHVSLWKVLYDNDYDKFVQEFCNETENHRVNNLKAEQENCKLADVVICLTDEMKTHIIKFYQTPEEKIRKVNNGLRKDNCGNVNLVKLETIKNSLQVKADDFVMLYVGRITTQKGVEYLFKSLEKLLWQGVNNIKLILIGDGTIQGRMEKEYFKLKDNYKFVGYVLPSEIGFYYRIANVIIFPSLNEQSSYVMIEAMKNRTPLLVTNIEAFEELEDTKSCMKIKLTPTHKIDVNDLAEKIKFMMHDQDFGVALADNAYKLYEKKYISDKMFVNTYKLSP